MVYDNNLYLKFYIIAIKISGRKMGKKIRLEVQVQGLSRLVPSEGCEGKAVPCFLPSLRWFPGTLWHSLVVEASLKLCLHLHVLLSL